MEVLNSFHKVAFLAFFTTQFSYPVTGQEVFSIIRNPGDGNLWNDFDRFKLPESKCSTDCSYWKAYPVNVPCQCKCSYNREATFGFYSGSWTCQANTEVRMQSGCQYKFVSEYKGYPLKIVERGQLYDAILPSARCSLDPNGARYFTCDGRWTGIGSQSSNQWFSIAHDADSNEHEVSIDSGISGDLLGRIISLNITCPQQHSDCLLFKLNGTLQCDENITSTKTARPTSSKPASTRKGSDETTPTASNATANPSDSEKKQKIKAESGSSSVVVGVVVTLVIIIVIVIVIVAYVYWKRKRGESVWLADNIYARVSKLRSSQPKKTPEDKTEEDPEYAEIPEEQRRTAPVDQAGGIYSFAFDDPQTAYIASQRAPYNRLVHNQQGLDQEGAIYSTAKDGPVYNVLERPPTGDQVVMASEDLEKTQDLDQVYHVLEEPGATDEIADSSLNGNTGNDGRDVRASVGTTTGGPPNDHVAPKARRRPPSPPRNT